MDNNEIFLDFWRTYQWPEPRPVLFRLYHDPQGRPIEYSQEDHDGFYIDITPEEFVRADFRVRVIDGKIVAQEPPPPPRLIKSQEGVRCHPYDVTVISQQDPYQAWSMKQDEN
jgi:hypothetical protein